jgi:hypothetical protein
VAGEKLIALVGRCELRARCVAKPGDHWGGHRPPIRTTDLVDGRGFQIVRNVFQERTRKKNWSEWNGAVRRAA